MSESSSDPGTAGTVDATPSAGPPVAASSSGMGAGPEECISCGQPLRRNSPNPGRVPTVIARSTGYVFAVGRLRASFPDSGVRREYAQAAGIHPDASVESSELKSVLAERDNRYLASQLCWILTAQSGDDACTVLPRNDADLDDLIDMLASEDDQLVQALIASQAATRTPFGCWTGDLPAMWPAQMLSFKVDEFIDAMAAAHQPKRPGADDKERDATSDSATLLENPRYRASVRSLFTRFTQRSGNTGTTDEDRACNFLALKDPTCYALNWQAVTEGKSLTNITTSALPRGTRRIVDVRLVFRHYQTHVTEAYHCHVDTTDLFCYKSLPLSPTYE